MDASQYKDYVLVLLFVKYISDRYAGQAYAPITIPDGASFTDMVALKGKADIGDQINKKILGPLAQANHLSDMPDFNDPTKLGDGKERVERLTNLIAIFENSALDFSKNRADGDDLLGDAYEYLMRHFATESGKSKGQFYTPAEVSRVIAQILGIRHAKISNDTSVYDPTCGSGSLLLKIGDEARHDEKDVKVSLYGQEKDNATAGLARMNMILHNYATADIKQGNTIANPLFLEGEALKTFDYVVANPPFSDKRWSTGLDPEQDPWQRFGHYGIPPKKQGDYAYLLHIVRSLKSTGKGVCVLPHGVLFRGGAEGAIRRNLVQRGYIRGIIGLPANLFYGTGIPACLVVIDKEGASGRRGIFMIDASKGFIKDGNKNRLREQDIHKIVDTFTRQADLPRYSRLVSVAEISGEKNDYNLNLARYINSSDPEDIQDINGHLRGGIPNGDIDALDNYWKILAGVRWVLFGKADRDGYSMLKLPIGEVKAAIFGHSEFAAFNGVIAKHLNNWEKSSIPHLKSFRKDGHPKALIETISENLLTTFEAAPLLNPYTVYQHLMDYWVATMQDDAYLIAGDGWIEAALPKLIVEDKNNKSKIKPDFVIGKKKYQAELIPPALIIRRWFANEQETVDRLQAELEVLQQRMEEMREEHGVEDGLLIEANNKGKYTKASVNARVKEIKNDDDVAEEIKTLKDYSELLDKEAVTEGRLAAAQDGLTQKLAAKYGALTESEVISLAVGDKWLATMATAVQGELDSVSQNLAERVRELAERYATPLPRLADEMTVLAARVDGHLKRMGAVWK
jgi:type I restriction enzyme M protein